ncbi:MAG: aldehyde dehydrogenase family protein [Candidatus Thioglobus sp.]|nr:aldehyde dehydrogenase family protein [Candidatus Thioglobus sp.]
MLDKRKFYINGQWVEPSKKNDFDVINPSDETVCAVISLGSQEDTNAAVNAAREALPSWSNSSKEDRVALLERLYSIYERRMDEMAEVISMEMGAPIDFAKRSQAPSGTEAIEDFLIQLKKFEFEKQLDDSDNQLIYEPKGVCALITPWNWPISQVALKVIPAIAAGCTMVLKPSEIAPLDSMIFAEMLEEAGCPAGVFNLVNGDGAGVGSQLTSHPDIDMISFTGSTRAGALISHNAAEDFKRVGLELGGKGANIIFADADEKAVKRGVRHCFNNTGQSCNAPTRMLVERSFYDKAVEIAKETALSTKTDIASKEGRHIGPLVSQLQFDKVQALIQAGIDEDATLVIGGTGKPEGLEKGYFVKPTIFANVNNDMTIARTEIFGPVLSMIPFDSEEEAIEIANDTPYGLENYVQTQDREKAKRISKKLLSGVVEVNGNSLALGSPFGGYKHSGIGREGGEHGFNEFIEVKVVTGWN